MRERLPERKVISDMKVETLSQIRQLLGTGNAAAQAPVTQVNRSCAAGITETRRIPPDHRDVRCFAGVSVVPDRAAISQAARPLCAICTDTAQMGLVFSAFGSPRSWRSRAAGCAIGSRAAAADPGGAVVVFSSPRRLIGLSYRSWRRGSCSARRVRLLPGARPSLPGAAFQWSAIPRKASRQRPHGGGGNHAGIMAALYPFSTGGWSVLFGGGVLWSAAFGGAAPANCAWTSIPGKSAWCGQNYFAR